MEPCPTNLLCTNCLYPNDSLEAWKASSNVLSLLRDERKFSRADRSQCFQLQVEGVPWRNQCSLPQLQSGMANDRHRRVR